MTAPSETVLIVEDERGVADLYAEWLEDDYEVLTAYTGESALDRLGSRVDYVLLDRRMPGLSGDEVLKEIHSKGTDCRVAMVTAVDPGYDIINMKMDGYVTKPVNRDDLLSLIGELRALNSYNDALQRYYRLMLKKSTLESNKSKEELIGNENYQRLVTKLEKAESEADDTVKDLDENPFHVLNYSSDSDRF